MTKKIKVSDTIHERLSKRGKFGETFSDIIERLLDECAEKDASKEEK